ncbi:spore germination protein [Paenibacillus sedimenti]|uniref:Spore germination protein n=1 Tax=Paenibacillus sedimenti TaxID=2770274 RepID=A0A926KU20_9BACL|nr:spore germination protein [Paenibacillus sedimenti]MBD0383527.1 spore germination protein [Paenibacillus sedimenti]
MSKFLKIFVRKLKEKLQHDAQANTQQAEALSGNLGQDINNIIALTGNSSDITNRIFQGANGLPMAIVYVNGLTDTVVINDNIMKPIMSDAEVNTAGQRKSSDYFTDIKDKILTVSATSTVSKMDELISALFNGDTVIIAEGWEQGISASSAKWMQRGVEEPSSQSVIRGPKDGFTEDISTNVALLRRRIKSPNLWKIDRKIGLVTQTDVSVMYLKGTANDLVVNEVLQRLDRIEIDGILESGYLEEFIQDQTFTPFPTIINTERPDSVAGSILDGQVAVLVDGTPFVLVLPITFFKFFVASEDYYQRFDISTFLRILRFFAFTVSMLLPSLYIAITTFHQEMIPTTLLVSLAAQREGIPFPAFFEALMMEITFEILREAGVRMPRAIGSAISIVGALVLGQAAVEAGLVSAAMVIVVAFTAISNFVVPAFNISIAARLLRFILMVLAAALGLFGIMSGLFFLLIHMLSLRSFGIPYLTPLAPFVPNNLKDTVVRVPWWMMVTRPRLFAKNNYVRQNVNRRPNPSDKDKMK